MDMTHIDLFTGIGGFSLACQWNGIRTEVMCEPSKQCQTILRRHFPNVLLLNTVQELLEVIDDFRADIITGGDPCPIRSKARSTWKTKMPDLSGYFLAVVGCCQPRWVVRENVPASDDVDFSTALEALGYRTVIIATNAAKITAQNRERDFIVGCPQNKYQEFITKLPLAENDKRYAETKYQKVPAYPVLTTHPCRWDTRDGYIWDGCGIRVANSKERLQLAGFPSGWLDGLSKTSVARMTGNAIVPQVACEIIKAIKGCQP